MLNVELGIRHINSSFNIQHSSPIQHSTFNITKNEVYILERKRPARLRGQGL